MAYPARTAAAYSMLHALGEAKGQRRIAHGALCVSLLVILFMLSSVYSIITLFSWPPAHFPDNQRATVPQAVPASVRAEGAFSESAPEAGQHHSRAVGGGQESHCPTYDCALARYDNSERLWGETPARQHEFSGYYGALYGLLWRYGEHAQSVLDVGSGHPPFLRLVTWVPNRTVVSPYFTTYDGRPGMSVEEQGLVNGIEVVKDDFMGPWNERRGRFDVVMCSQVVEHIDDPPAFVKKLLEVGDVLILSVPYRWAPCGKQCRHVWNYIDEHTVRRWAAPAVETEFAVVRDVNAAGQHQLRVVFVFQRAHHRRGSATYSKPRHEAHKRSIHTPASCGWQRCPNSNESNS